MWLIQSSLWRPQLEHLKEMSSNLKLKFQGGFECYSGETQPSHEQIEAPPPKKKNFKHKTQIKCLLKLQIQCQQFKLLLTMMILFLVLQDDSHSGFYITFKRIFKLI